MSSKRNALAILAGVLAAVLVMSVIVFPSAYADKDDNNNKNKGKDDDKKEKHNEKLEQVIVSILKEVNDDKTAALPSSGTLTMTANGLVVERSRGGIEVADAKLDMSGSVHKVEGSHLRILLNGTLNIDNEKYKIDAEGRVKLSKSDHGTGSLDIRGKTDDGDKFTLKAMILPSSLQSGEWKLVTMPAAKLGSHIKIYLIGEMHLNGSAGGGSDDDNNNTELSHFEISHIANQTAGNQFAFTVKAIDEDGHIKTDYNGTVTITTNGGSSPMGNTSSFVPNPYTFNATADKGQHMFTAKMYNAKSNVTITVSGSGKTGTSNKFNVVPAAAASVKVLPATATVPSNGTQNFNATAYDAYGNQVINASFTWSQSPTTLGTLTVSATDSSKAMLKAAVVSSSTGGTITATVTGTTVHSTAAVTITPLPASP